MRETNEAKTEGRKKRGRRERSKEERKIEKINRIEDLEIKVRERKQKQISTWMREKIIGRREGREERE